MRRHTAAPPHTGSWRACSPENLVRSRILSRPPGGSAPRVTRASRGRSFDWRVRPNGLKYRESDFWQRRAAERGLTCRGLERAGQHRLVGPKDDAVRTAIERLAERFNAGEHRNAIDLVALCAASGRSEEAHAWWGPATTQAGRLWMDDFIVLQASGAFAVLPASGDAALDPTGRPFV